MNKTLKILFWLLIAVNVIFFAVMKSGVLNDEQATQVLHPMHEEKISLLVAPQSAPVAAQSAVVPQAGSIASSVPAQSVVAPVVAPIAASAPAVVKSDNLACFEWGDFSGAGLDHAVRALKKLQLGDKLSQREIDRVIGFWVYIPPLKDKAAVNQKLAQLKARGVTDYFVVQEAGEWLNAISLGVFKSRESAQNFLEGLREKNVATAKMGERSGKNKATVFIINGLDADMNVRLAALQKDFAGSELKLVSCH